MSLAPPRLGQPLLAAITFSPHGGGIAAVSRLVRHVLADVTPGAVSSVTLATHERRFETTTTRRVVFGLQVASAPLRGCDWVFYTHLHLAAVQQRIPRGLARPYAVFLHDVEAWSPLGGRMKHVLAGAFLRVANSSYTAGRIAAAHPDVGDIVACPLALPPQPMDAPPGADRPGPRSRAVVIVGRMTAADAYKGHDQLIAAWPEVLARVPDATLICVGEGDDVGRLREKAAAAGVGAAVRFPGFVDDATRSAIYRQAAVLAMPSRREGFGLVYIEAMAAGVPCIGSVHDAASDVIVDGETGYLVDQSDRAGLVGRLVGLLLDEPRRQRFGAAGYARYRRLFTYEAFRDRLAAAIAAALPATAAGARLGRQQPGAV